jgi:hypothetical protein
MLQKTHFFKIHFEFCFHYRGVFEEVGCSSSSFVCLLIETILKVHLYGKRKILFSDMLGGHFLNAYNRSFRVCMIRKIS